jgi:uncharacterized protein (DUF4415 family)
VALGFLGGVTDPSYALKLKMKSATSPSAKRQRAKKSFSSKASKTDRARIKRVKDTDIKLTAEHPEAEVKHIVRCIVRRGLKAVPAKASISLRIDADVLEWCKAQGPGYYTRLNAVLRAFKDASL